MRGARQAPVPNHGHCAQVEISVLILDQFASGGGRQGDAGDGDFRGLGCCRAASRDGAAGEAAGSVAVVDRLLCFSKERLTPKQSKCRPVAQI